MEIANHLPKFEDKIALLIVCGKQHGRFFIAHKGFIFEVGNFKLDKPRYSDREGFFETRSKLGKAKSALKGQVIRSGSVYEPKDNIIFKNTVKEVSDRLKRLSAEYSIDELYIYSPRHLFSSFLNQFPREKKEIVAGIFDGDYSNKHVFELLEEIQLQREENKVVLSTPEAQKIIKKSRQASKVIRRKGKKPLE